MTRNLLKTISCMVLTHDWRMASNKKRTCRRCGKRQYRAAWDPNEWLTNGN